MNPTRMMKWLWLACLGLPRLADAQSPVLDGYIQEGIRSNLALQQEQLELEKSMESLQQARALYLPRLYLNATYTLAGGGRRLQFPVGDLLNPVYATLNQMTGIDRFPSIRNVDEQLAPNNFHETTVAFQQPIFNSDLYFAYKIQQDMVSAQAARRGVYENELRYTIAGAYYQYLQTLEAGRIWEQSRAVLRELLKLNQKLVANNAATKDVVYSAEYELAKIEQQMALARRNEHTARAYFNFLLNRDLAADITADTAAHQAQTLAPLPDLQEAAIGNRQEISQLQYSLKANAHAIRLHRSSRLLPTVFVGGSLGYQGFGYRFDAGQRFGLAQFGLQWNLFRGGEKKSKERQARLQARVLESKHDEVRQQIKLQVTQAWYDLAAARQSLAAAEIGLEKAGQSYRIIDSRYRNQQALLVELLRAENDVTTARLSAVAARYEVLARQAQLNKVQALR